MPKHPREFRRARVPVLMIIMEKAGPTPISKIQRVVQARRVVGAIAVVLKAASVAYTRSSIDPKA